MIQDHTTLHLSSKSIVNLNICLNKDLNNVIKWCKENDMTINSKKSKCMLVGSDRKLVNCNEFLCVLSQDNIALDNVEVEKLLGIHIDKNLSWSIQIDKICETISTRIYLLKRLKRYLPLKGLILFYNSYILPIIDYCCTVWGLTTHINLERIHKLQKRAARLVLSVPFDFPSTVMFKKNLHG